MTTEFVTLTFGNGQYRVRNTPERIAEVTKRLKAADKPQKTVIEQAEAAYKSQIRTKATPKELERIMGELVADDEYEEVAPEYAAPLTMPELVENCRVPFYIPTFTELRV